MSTRTAVLAAICVTVTFSTPAQCDCVNSASGSLLWLPSLFGTTEYECLIFNIMPPLVTATDRLAIAAPNIHYAAVRTDNPWKTYDAVQLLHHGVRSFFPMGHGWSDGFGAEYFLTTYGIDTRYNWYIRPTSDGGAGWSTSDIERFYYEPGHIPFLEFMIDGMASQLWGQTPVNFLAGLFSCYSMHWVPSLVNTDDTSAHGSTALYYEAGIDRRLACQDYAELVRGLGCVYYDHPLPGNGPGQRTSPRSCRIPQATSSSLPATPVTC